MTSPASSGPAGPHFEGQVAAYYLLSLLTGAQPRGLSGTTIEKIELQRASEGHPLDDVIIHAHDAQGAKAVLAIQVKRSITFAPSDPVFRSVVHQIAKTAGEIDLDAGRYEFAIAIARTSRKIDGAYQDVLAWARDLDSAKTFIERIHRTGSANDDMRSFVQTFRAQLIDAGESGDDETVWCLLRRLQILTFDFTAPGSASEELAKERAAGALHPNEADRGSSLWASLIELALRVAATAGDRTREHLLEDLRAQSFRLTGERRFASARAALSEAADHALSDINDRVGDAILTRLERLDAVRTALDQHGYVEIRGEAGVGKSAVLKHIARQIAQESQLIVLAPDRTVPRGWLALRSALGFDGSARELFADLAADGGAVLFIDNLDNFDEQEQKTVSDLVREAAKTPGFAVLATARRSFGTEEPSFLSSAVLTQLGSAPPFIMSELSESEVDELKDTAPALRGLLSDQHPAREVTRNLYRLSRLSNLGTSEPSLRTEIDMAEQWWQSADGRRDEGHRERARLLGALANQALRRTQPLNVSGQPAAAINALVRSETLRDLGNDHVAFRHDVLREWSIANLLHTDSTALGRMPLESPAPASMARGLELAARMVLERDQDSARWSSLLSSVSGGHVHLSWRRAVLLAPVRSETSAQLLERLSEPLFADRAALLCELIRTVMAVEAEPIAARLVAAGMDAAFVPKDLKAPSGPSWYRLILWLLNVGEKLPGAAVPDVVALYGGWCTGLLGRDRLTPTLVRWLYYWLLQIETADDADDPSAWREPFDGQLDSHQLRPLTEELRAYFVLFSNHTPDLAVHYLQVLLPRRPDDVAVRSVLSSRGTLAQAAPAELAQLTAAALIPKESHARRHREFDEPFEYMDHLFIPASPAQGPFYELLVHAPLIGLALIRQLVEHAIEFYTRGRAYESDAIRLSIPDGERIFPWTASYAWSRQGAHHQCVTSALMALEAWGHTRIEAGASIPEVLSQVLGTDEVPAAYLLVAVDLLLSHWEKSREAVIPLLASPELLCLDRERHIMDEIPHSDLLGLGGLQKEPLGPITLETLKKRSSRRRSLDEMLGNYARGDAAEYRPALAELLRQAQLRVGEPAPGSTLRDPAFMTRHALNLIDPANWREVSVTLRDGSVVDAFQYAAPREESEHLQPLQEGDQERQTDVNFESRVSLALENPARSSPELAEAAVAWAQTAKTERASERDENWMREHAIYATALIAARDLSAELRTRHETWIRGIFTQALIAKDDPVDSLRPGIRYNPVAIAFVGLVHLLKDGNTADVRRILEIAARENPAGASGLAAMASQLAHIDPRLPRALVRCAFAACVRETREWDATEEDVAAQKERFQERMLAVIDAEIAWLSANGKEPSWPAFPLEPVRTRRRRRSPRSSTPEGSTETPTRTNARVFDQAASLWLRAAATLKIAEAPWLCDVIGRYSLWTLNANGAGRPPEEEIRAPDEWNAIYFELRGSCLPTIPSLEQLPSLKPIIELPDESFLDILPTFVRSLDTAYFETLSLQPHDAVKVRAVLANRLMGLWGWRRLHGSPDDSVEWHLGPAVAVLLFNDFLRPFPARCYLYPPAISRADPFLALLEQMNRTGASSVVALFTLNFLEVSPKWSHLPFILAAAEAWLSSYPDSTAFWVSRSMGQRLCQVIERAVGDRRPDLDREGSLRALVDRLLAALVRVGVFEASALERRLALSS